MLFAAVSLPEMAMLSRIQELFQDTEREELLSRERVRKLGIYSRSTNKKVAISFWWIAYR